jgi:hypothetical protein
VAASGPFRTIVTVLSDTGERYVSTGMWDMDPAGAPARLPERAGQLLY